MSLFRRVHYSTVLQNLYRLVSYPVPQSSVFCSTPKHNSRLFNTGTGKQGSGKTDIAAKWLMFHRRQLVRESLAKYNPVVIDLEELQSSPKAPTNST